MGKKRERRLQAEINALTTRVSQLVRANDTARNDREMNLAAAQREMAEDWFAIITKSGKVIRGKAVTAGVHSAPIDITSSGSAWRMFTPGPKERTAQIIIEPIK